MSVLKHKSGYQKREVKQDQMKIISKLPKLDSFFAKNAYIGVDNSEDVDRSNVIVDLNYDQE